MTVISDLLKEMVGRTRNVRFKGVNDDVVLMLQVAEFPPSHLKMRPMDIMLDGKSVVHEALGAEDTYMVEEGEELSVEAELTTWTIISEGPGPEELSISFETQ